MKQQTVRNFHGGNGQRGATLIVVLMILLIITVVGVMAIRVAIVSLGVATNSQVDQLNFQSSDTPLVLLSHTDPSTLTSFGNAIGASLRESESNPGGEYIFCYKPTSTTVKFAQTVDAALIKAGDDNDANKESGIADGFCTVDADFGSNRAAVVTQVAVSIPTDASTDDPGANLPRDINLSEGAQLPKSMTSTQRVRVTTTAMLPGYSPTSTSTIQENCLSVAHAKISDNLSEELKDKETLADCLKTNKVPYSVQVQEFNYLNRLTEVQAPGG
ncbi:pilus assembly PilX N-terminal domain-containing protein [Acinetobacter chinensis]|uniref:Pilus assembly PilX N-terminal domain-containing protein n=1 Tax=Acinetobacter chinensis TaxID=2004650 RepID=A0ABU3WGL9_9GAMM|nr:pilus assembly PilX N-terminal domain-containing protein [Acinetobacter chinensis]MDV2469346.1 pilus assembly PilX N-terminal domain-containing protein [Acinetobacter chinensis]